MPYININDVNLYYTDSGTAGDPIVFIHGWGTSGRVWDQQASYFAQRNRTIQLDWRGCGLSETWAYGNTIEQNASDVVELLHHLDLNNVTLVGTSMGGSFAIEAARQCPERLKALVTVDSPFHAGTFTSESEVLPILESLITNRVPTLMDMVSTWYACDRCEDYEFWARAQVLNSSPHIAGLYLEHLKYDPRPYLSEISVPISLIHGSEDPDVPVAIAHEIATLLNAPLHVIDGAGHFPHHSDATEFNAILASILDA